VEHPLPRRRRHQLTREGHPPSDADLERLSPFVHEHISMLGRYSFALALALALAAQQLRPFRGPATDPRQV